MNPHSCYCAQNQYLSEQMISLILHENFNAIVSLKFWKSKQTEKPTIDNFYNLRITNLDLYKIDKDNQELLELRSQSVTEQNKLQDPGKEDNANEYDVTTATEKTLNNDEANLRGEEFSVMITYGLRAFDSYIEEL